MLGPVGVHSVRGILSPESSHSRPFFTERSPGAEGSTSARKNEHWYHVLRVTDRGRARGEIWECRSSRIDFGWMADSFLLGNGRECDEEGIQGRCVAFYCFLDCRVRLRELKIEEDVHHKP